MEFRMAGQTDVGRARARNEDALLQRPGRGILAVADGMGGHAAGDIASRIAVDIVDDRSAHLPDDGVSDYLRDTVRAAHEAILKAADADPELEGMGTTLTVLHMDAEDGRVVIAHVGDSRAYRWRDERLEQLTRDQTWVQEQVEAGILTRIQAQDHPFSAMLTGALGIRDDDLDIEILEPAPEPDDLFLLCSDGLVARLRDDELRSVLLDHEELEEIAGALVDAANQAGGPDNITVGLLRILG